MNTLPAHSNPAPGPDADAANRTSALLLGLQSEARAAPDRTSLGFVMVNRTRALVAYDRAVLFVGAGGRSPRTTAISNIAVIERNAPMTVWLNRVISHLGRDAIGLDDMRVIEAGDLPAGDVEQGMAWWSGPALWVPLTRQNRPAAGGLLLARGTGSWTQAERVLLENLADCYGHAWWALRPRRRLFEHPLRAFAGWSVVLALLAALAVPVPQSVVVDAQVVATTPTVVAAPMDGVIKAIAVRPNQPVERGAVLFRYVAEEIEASLAVAEQAVAAAEADLRKVQQQAFGDARSKADIELKEAALQLKRVERDFGRFLASQIEVRADRDGIALFSDAAEWQGRPVETGRRIMRIADPQEIEVEMRIPVGDAVATQAGSPVSLFLDIDPLNPIEARLQRVAYGAEATESGVLAYRATARFADLEAANRPRIGLHGTARISGDPVPLALFLFRRPISATRQFLGF